MTQPDLIIEYIKIFGKITPATLNDESRGFMKGEWLGSETGRACRTLRGQNRLVSDGTGKYTYFTFPILKSLRRATQAELGQSNDKTEELNNTLKDILGKLRVSWDMGDKYKEIDNAIKSKNVILKNLTIKKYERKRNTNSDRTVSSSIRKSE